VEGTHVGRVRKGLQRNLGDGEEFHYPDSDDDFTFVCTYRYKIVLYKYMPFILSMP
jgi:hypothetical protein